MDEIFLRALWAPVDACGRLRTPVPLVTSGAPLGSGVGGWGRVLHALGPVAPPESRVSRGGGRATLPVISFSPTPLTRTITAKRSCSVAGRFLCRAHTTDMALDTRCASRSRRAGVCTYAGGWVDVPPSPPPPGTAMPFPVWGAGLDERARDTRCAAMTKTPAEAQNQTTRSATGPLTTHPPPKLGIR